MANQAWTRGATRRQQITDLINDRRASARLILAPKKLGNKVGWWRSGVFRFADINTWWGMQLLLHTLLFKVLLFRLRGSQRKAWITSYHRRILRGLKRPTPNARGHPGTKFGCCCMRPRGQPYRSQDQAPNKDILWLICQIHNFLIKLETKWLKLLTAKMNDHYSTPGAVSLTRNSVVPESWFL